MLRRDTTADFAVEPDLARSARASQAGGAAANPARPPRTTSGTAISATSMQGPAANSQRLDRFVAAVERQALRREIAGRVRARTSNPAIDNMPVDCLIAAGQEPHLPDEVFPHLRWGGVFVYVAEQAQPVQRLAEMYDGRRGFSLEQRPTYAWHAPLGLRLPPLASKGHYFIARKTQLLQPGDMTDRFTYHVELVPYPNQPHGYAVRKTIPTYDNVLWRLQRKYPEIDNADLERRRASWWTLFSRRF